MTFTEVIAAIIIITLFLTGFSQAVTPAFSAWTATSYNYSAGHSINFLSVSFRKECAKAYPDFNKWKRDISVIQELESCEIEMLCDSDTVRAYKAVCFLYGEAIEIIGTWVP